MFIFLFTFFLSMGNFNSLSPKFLLLFFIIQIMAWSILPTLVFVSPQRFAFKLFVTTLVGFVSMMAASVFIFYFFIFIFIFFIFCFICLFFYLFLFLKVIPFSDIGK